MLKCWTEILSYRPCWVVAEVFHCNLSCLFIYLFSCLALLYFSEQILSVSPPITARKEKTLRECLWEQATWTGVMTSFLSYLWMKADIFVGLRDDLFKAHKSADSNRSLAAGRFSCCVCFVSVCRVFFSSAAQFWTHAVFELWASFTTRVSNHSVCLTKGMVWFNCCVMPEIRPIPHFNRRLQFNKLQEQNSSVIMLLLRIFLCRCRFSSDVGAFTPFICRQGWSVLLLPCEMSFFAWTAFRRGMCMFSCVFCGCPGSVSLTLLHWWNKRISMHTNNPVIITLFQRSCEQRYALSDYNACLYDKITHVQQKKVKSSHIYPALELKTQ